MGSLLLADELLEKFGATFKYWSSLAMFAHTCRDVAKPLYETYCSNFGDKAGKDTVKCLFPRPVSQRWGRIHELEKCIIDAGFLQLAICLADVLAEKFIDANELQGVEEAAAKQAERKAWEAVGYIQKAIKMKKKGRDAEAKKAEQHASTPNELSIEQTKAYTIQMSKWRGKTLCAVADRLWGKTIQIMYHARCPIIHLTSFLKKDFSEQDMCSKGGPLVQLAVGRAAEIHGEFTSILRDSSESSSLVLEWSSVERLVSQPRAPGPLLRN